jgi:hypothetical protein
VQIRFAVEVLPRKTQIKNKVTGAACLLWILVRQGFSEGSTVPAPDRVAVAVRNDSGSVEMIGVDINTFATWLVTVMVTGDEMVLAPRLSVAVAVRV